jgi:N-acetylneuraminic acid mutarotase
MATKKTSSTTKDVLPAVETEGSISRIGKIEEGGMVETCTIPASVLVDSTVLPDQQSSSAENKTFSSENSPSEISFSFPPPSESSSTSESKVSSSESSSSVSPTSESKVFPSSEGSSNLPTSVPEQKVGTIFAVGGLTTGNALDAGMEKYCLSTKTWKLCTRFPTLIKAAATVGIDNEIFVLGGSITSNGAPTSAVWRYDINEDKWFPSVDLLEPRHQHAAVVIGKSIFVIGGLNLKDNVTASLHEFNTETKKWTERKSMSTFRYAHTAVAVGNTIYVLGGASPGDKVNDQSKRLNSVEKYDVATGEWSSCTKMPIFLFDGRAVAVGQSIYVTGGHLGSTTSTTIDEKTNETLTITTSLYNDLMYKYDVVTDSWTNLGLIPRPRAAHGLVILGTCIYVIGGIDQHSMEDCDCYDIITGKWSVCSGMLSKRKYFGVVAIPWERQEEVDTSTMSGCLSLPPCYTTSLNSCNEVANWFIAIQKARALEEQKMKELEEQKMKELEEQKMKELEEQKMKEIEGKEAPTENVELPAEDENSEIPPLAEEVPSGENEEKAIGNLEILPLEEGENVEPSLENKDSEAPSIEKEEVVFVVKNTEVLPETEKTPPTKQGRKKSQRKTPKTTT